VTILDQPLSNFWDRAGPCRGSVCHERPLCTLAAAPPRKLGRRETAPAVAFNACCSKTNSPREEDSDLLQETPQNASMSGLIGDWK
jgi:hypothetical protein